MNSSTGVEKKKRTRLSLGEKLEAARLLRSGKTNEHIMNKFKVSRRTATNIRKQSDQIFQQSERTTNPLHHKDVRPSLFPKIERALIRFVSVCRANKLPVTQLSMQIKALEISKQLLQRAETEKEKCDFTSFAASKGWITNFVKRNGIRSVSLHGEAGGVDILKETQGMVEIRNKLSAFDPDCIFNVDETGLFYKLMPRRTYVLETEHKKTLRGTKAMKAKDRVTAYVCTNATGTVKLPMAIIGKSKKPRCFRLGEPPVPYFSQRNAWSDTATFKLWFTTVFLPTVRSRNDKKVALVMDNCGPHGAELVDMQEQVSIITLPPNCTSVHQPMDLGIIAAWKRKYRSALVEEVVRDIENRQARRSSAAALKAGMKGLSEGFDPHLLDVCRLSSASWEDITTDTIRRCWVKANVLHPAQVATLNNLTDAKSKTIEGAEKEDTDVLVSKMKAMRLLMDRRDPFYDQTRDVIEIDDAFRWFNIEDDAVVKECMVEDDLLLATGSECDVEGAGGVLVSEEELHPADIEDDGAVDPLPPHQVIVSTFRDAEELAYNCGISEASHLLRRAKNVCLTLQRKQASGRSRQLRITEMFKTMKNGSKSHPKSTFEL